MWRSADANLVPMNNSVVTLAELQKRSVDALRVFVSSSSDDSERTELLRTVADQFVRAREFFFNAEGEPDYLGRTGAYRRWVKETTTNAGVPREDLSNVQAAIRYHLGNILRERLDKETLEALGLRALSPKDRHTEKRGRQSSTLQLFGTGGGPISAEEDLLSVAHIMERTLQRVDLGSVAHLSPSARAEVHTRFSAAVKRAKAIVDAAK